MTCTLDIAAALAALFGPPVLTDIAGAFALGFITPMTVYLGAYMVGTLVNFWNR